YPPRRISLLDRRISGGRHAAHRVRTPRPLDPWLRPLRHLSRHVLVHLRGEPCAPPGSRLRDHLRIPARRGCGGCPPRGLPCGGVRGESLRPVLPRGGVVRDRVPVPRRASSEGESGTPSFRCGNPSTVAIEPRAESVGLG